MAHSTVAADMKVPDTRQAFAHTHALWRFLASDHVDVVALSGSIQALARAAVPQHWDACALVIHAWSRLKYGGHASKKDRLQMTHITDIGYEPQSSLRVSDRDGAPLVVAHADSGDG